MMAAAQALDMRKKSMGRGTSIAHRIIRESVDYLSEDRPLYRDHNEMVQILKSERIINEIEDGLNIEL